MYKATILSGLCALFSLQALAFPLEGPSASTKRQGCEFDSANSPECWGDFSLSTNWYEEAPDTGVVREYWFNVHDTTMALDGVSRPVVAINGSIPGPTITADWGDTVVVHVSNSATNGTSIHWHGLRQNHTSEDDGVASITQCPIAPGDSLTYTWKATQYGTTWYHSHYSLQAWNGVFGGIIINGPASSAYDEDKGIMMLSDWFHVPVEELYVQASTGGPPQANNGLINGVNVYSDGGGSRYGTTFEAGKSYRFRLVNSAIDTMFRFMIDNHTLTVISSDLVPITPYETTTINVGIGQRYDVVVTANQDAKNYWMRSIPQTSCSSNEMTLDIKGIITYDGVDVADPDTSMWDYVDSCDDETLNLAPFLSLDAGNSDTENIFDIGLSAPNGLFVWTINDNAFLSDWGSPTLKQVLDGSSDFETEQQVVQLNEQNDWVYFIIESQIGLAHPVHLHGHDFFVLAQEAASTYSDSTPLNLVNPPRRDVAMLPAAGFLVIAFQSDNPGVWLMHCHIGWHTAQGFALQLVERLSEISATANTDVVDQTCSNWSDYAVTSGLVQEDSGV
ncbi:multicopper oxidase [Pseudomassariella vexata]|uniref:laccase n=1 Tax=Pseudomassariella vexata TaxID=1141098 RepID=A0A1Y2EAW0_9PEZI|nr:multicopper oxidase [Pseudomassariella vexata]ORY68701.1 multicopper oxidase [Pseudomassariella vexata]